MGIYIIYTQYILSILYIPLDEKQCCPDGYKELAHEMLSFVRTLPNTLCEI